MFVYYFTHVNLPFEETRRILLSLLDGFVGAADIAYRRGEELGMRAGIDQSIVAKTGKLAVGEPLSDDGELIVPLTWEPTGRPALFPRMEADLVAASLGPRLSQITFRGSYKPPFGAMGEVLDRALLHRVAEATVKHFVDRVAAAVVGWPEDESQLAAGATDARARGQLRIEQPQATRPR